MSIYEEIGGRAAVRAVVKVFYDRVTTDPLLAAHFEGVDMERLAAHQRAFLSAALGGPELFAGRDLHAAHAHLGVTDEAFDAIVEHLALSLLDLDVPPETVEQVRARIETMRVDVVS